MEVTLTSDQQSFARRAIESGRLQDEAGVVTEALSLWEERERQRLAFLATLEESRAFLLSNGGREITEQSTTELATAIKQRGRARLAAELATSR